MKSYSILGYTYDADIHCPACASAAGMTYDGARDSEGNEVGVLFADGASEAEYCGDCGECIYDPDDND